MAHYFDDIMHRHVNAPESPQTPRTPGPGGRRLLRRSSTARSISARSDFERDYLNGNDDDTDGDGATRRGSTSTHGDPGRMEEKARADEHMHRYISEQLERVRTERGGIGYSGGEEFEAQANS